MKVHVIAHLKMGRNFLGVSFIIGLGILHFFRMMRPARILIPEAAMRDTLRNTLRKMLNLFQLRSPGKLVILKLRTSMHYLPTLEGLRIPMYYQHIQQNKKHLAIAQCRQV